MSGTLFQILGIVAVIALFATILIRPAGVLLAILAVGFVIAAIVINWRDIQQYRIQKAAMQQPAAVSGPAAPPEYPRPGS